MTVHFPRTGPEEQNGLRQISPPVEPRIAYPEPHLSNIDSLSLIRGKTFFAANQLGDLMPPGAPHVGLFCDDTRYLSHLELLINGHAPVVLSCTTDDGAYANRIELTVKGSLMGEGLDLPVNTVYVRRQQVLENDSLHDVLHLENFHTERAQLKIQIDCDADFMDIFQVRGIIRGKSGRYYAPIGLSDRIVFLYEGLDGRTRSTTVAFDPPPTTISGKRASWDLCLEPLGKVKVTVTITQRSEETGSEATAGERFQGPADFAAIAEHDVLQKPLRSLHHDFEEWRQSCTQFRSNNEIFNTILNTAVQDFYALQIPDGGHRAIAAGVPWFVALFGRDSLIASFETLVLNPTLARGTLRVLASHQGKTEEPERDEDPGKILHEMRSGEMTATGEIAFGMYYGSVDATPLFVILLSEYFQWTGDEDFLREMQPALLAAVEWLAKYGELHHDGLVRYARKTPAGLFNQGWKDSGDANMHSNGTIAQPPIALVEVQGYAADAFTRAAALLRLLGSEAAAEKLAQRCANLLQSLERSFWLPDKKYYAMALDRDNQPLEVMASNPGHLLFANAIDAGRAQSVVDHLIGSGLYSGWGIRTLSQQERTYNPMSYHRGSVWPHDNALIAYGMARYGFQEASSQIFSGLFDASLFFRDYRLPELFCGIQRRRRDEPVQYPVSCSPQAWASGAAFLILTGLLGLRPDVPNRIMKIVNPCLPPFLDHLELRNLRIGRSRLSLEFTRQGEHTFCNVTERAKGDLEVRIVYQ